LLAELNNNPGLEAAGLSFQQHRALGWLGMEHARRRSLQGNDLSGR
jgi:hypothetical protein